MQRVDYSAEMAAKLTHYYEASPWSDDAIDVRKSLLLVSRTGQQPRFEKSSRMTCDAEMTGWSSPTVTIRLQFRLRLQPRVKTVLLSA